MIGAYTYALIATSFGINPWFTLPLAALGGAILGLIVERLLIRPLYDGYRSWSFVKDEYAVVVTFALSLLLIHLVDKVIGPSPFMGPSLFSMQRISIGPIMLNGQKLISSGVSIFLLISLAIFIKKSLWGKQIQAVAQNRFGAALAGIDPVKTTALIFAIAGGLAALSGALLSPIVNPSPDIGSFPAIKSYVIVVLGGLGSIWGSMFAALILGVLESYFAVYVSYDYRDAFGLLILICVLIFRPNGLAGMKGREI